MINFFKKNPAQFEYEIDLCHLFHDILVEKLCRNNELKIRWELKSISAIIKGRIKRHKEKIDKFQELIDIASKKKNNLKIACVYFSEIGEESPIFGIFQHPDNFCAVFN